MAKELSTKDNAVIDALKRLRDEEMELSAKLRPVQEAITALEKIVEKSANKKVKSPSKEIEVLQEETADEIA